MQVCTEIVYNTGDMDNTDRKWRQLACLAACIVAACAVADVCGDFPDVAREDTWGGRKAHPAVVNSVMEVEVGSVVSLRGEWEFLTPAMVPGKKRPWRNGKWRHLYSEREWPWARTIFVPGCWEAQGVGEEGHGESWDPYWDENSKPIRHKHMGDGWYRKTVAIPSEWAGKRVWLKVGGVKSKGWFWVNDRQVALVDSYCGTYKYDVTDLVTPGSNAVVVAQASNKVPSRKGLFSAMHRWGGLYRDVELEATPQTYIDDAWVRGDFDAQEAELHVAVGGCDVGRARCPQRADRRLEDKPPYQLRVTVDGRSSTHPLANSTLAIRLPLAELRPWSPEHPNLYTGLVELVENGRVVHTRRERFGVRKFEVRGTEFYLNNKPFYVRGFGDDHVYPLTGMTPPDREFHRAHLAKARKAGFNFVRLHTHCEVPEYFEAADEVGIMIQPELPYYSDVPTEGFEFDPKRDVTELYTHFRRHPSFAVYSMGNEGSFGKELDRKLHAYVKAMDPDRLKINQDCGEAWINPPDAADYTGGPINVWPRGSFDPDRPFVTHEYLNLCVKCDSRDEPRYAGVWLPPVSRQKRSEWLAKFGLDMEWGDRLQDAQHALQRHYQKLGLESARKDPYCDGYSFWTIADVCVAQGESYTAQGLFNPFWEQKRGGFSAEEFAQFNSPSCVLIDTPDENRVFTSGETLSVDFLFAHYGEADLKDAVLEWHFSNPSNLLNLSNLPIGDIPLGHARKVATEKIAFPLVEKPVKTTLLARIGNASNSWDFWVFPRRERRDGSRIAVASSLRESMAKLYDGFSVLGSPEAKDASVAVVEAGSPEEESAIKEGRRVIVIGKAEGVPNCRLGWWWMGDQVGTALLKHPAFGDLPHEGCLSPLLFRIIGKGKPLDGAVKDVAELLMVGEGGNECFAYLVRRREGGSDVLESFGIDLLSGKPEGTSILDGMISLLLEKQNGGIR